MKKYWYSDSERWMHRNNEYRPLFFLFPSLTPNFPHFNSDLTDSPTVRLKRRLSKLLQHFLYFCKNIIFYILLIIRYNYNRFNSEWISFNHLFWFFIEFLAAIKFETFVYMKLMRYLIRMQITSLRKPNIMILCYLWNMKYISIE